MHMDLDYYTDIWRREGQLRVALPLWLPVPRRFRITLIERIWGNPFIEIPRIGSRYLRIN